ncbi:hypothetical protein M2277_004957 [Paenibacillus sp. LBL]|uniref:hypothetical protein n=1 Tax=Paenibacillus sp. LBL TaxID=2940563 RepID=UPI002473ACF7|nr:hypothetical protein [Paenibacillus sp. LBL]MDH6674265.1 hypothetical protein [Paenibacillus sp. LBL]
METQLDIQAWQKYYDNKYGRPNDEGQEIDILTKVYRRFFPRMTIAEGEGIAEYYRSLKAKGLPAYLWMQEAIHVLSKKHRNKQSFRYFVGILRHWTLYGFGHIQSEEEDDIIEYFMECSKLNSEEVSAHSRSRLRNILGSYGVVTLSKILNEVSNMDKSRIFVDLIETIANTDYETSYQKRQNKINSGHEVIEEPNEDTQISRESKLITQPSYTSTAQVSTTNSYNSSRYANTTVSVSTKPVIVAEDSSIKDQNASPITEEKKQLEINLVEPAAKLAEKEIATSLEIAEESNISPLVQNDDVHEKKENPPFTIGEVIKLKLAEKSSNKPVNEERSIAISNKPVSEKEDKSTGLPAKKGGLTKAEREEVAEKLLKESIIIEDTIRAHGQKLKVTMLRDLTKDKVDWGTNAHNKINTFIKQNPNIVKRDGFITVH